MEIRQLYSISEIKPEDCLNTGCKPVKVFCSDFEFYICKYSSSGSAYTLFSEYIAASFLKLWELEVPDFNFIKIKDDHILKINIPKYKFERNCFGSKYMGHFKEVDKLFYKSEIIRNNKKSLLSYLSIGLFDIWICNEDRHSGNFNLLYNMEERSFIPIDHNDIFNGNNIDKEPYLISDYESILFSPLLKQILSRNLQAEIKRYIDQINKDFFENVTLCQNKIDSILSSIPDDWQLDIAFLKTRLALYFDIEWQNECFKHFEKIIQLNLKK